MEALETVKVPRPPEGLQPTGRALWRDAVAAYTFTVTELGLLRELCRAHDTATRLTNLSKGATPMVKGSRNQPIVNPLFAEIRANQEIIVKLSRALALPDDRRNQGHRRLKTQTRVNAIQNKRLRDVPA